MADPQTDSTTLVVLDWWPFNRSERRTYLGGLRASTTPVDYDECCVTLMTAPFGSRTKNRRRPHSSSVSG
jgi:hypothetical protein